MTADYNDSAWFWRYVQQFVVTPLLGLQTVLGALLPFPLQNAEGILWKSNNKSPNTTAAGRLSHSAFIDGTPGSSANNTATSVLIPSGGSDGGAVVLPGECLVAPRHFATLTNGAQSLEDAVGWAFERSVPLVLVLHSELSRESCYFLDQLGRAVNACAGLSQSGKNSGGGLGQTCRGADGLQHRSGTSATVDGAKSLAPATPAGAATNGSCTATCPLNSTLGRVQWYVLSMFSEECSYLSAAAACAAPAILTFVPLGGPSGMTQLGSLEGPMTTTDVAKFVKQCEEKWHACPEARFAARTV